MGFWGYVDLGLLGPKDHWIQKSFFASQNFGWPGRGFNLRVKMVSLRVPTIGEKMKNEKFLKPGIWGTWIRWSFLWDAQAIK